MNQIPFQNRNFNNINNNNKPLMQVNNKKYSDFEIKTFFKEENEPNKSGKDILLKNELNKITDQYISIFNDINKLSDNSSKDDDNISNKLNTIKKELKQIDYFNGNEYSNFIRQLYEVSKDDKVLNSGYDSFKNNNKEINQEIKTIISDYKYDIVLYKNKDSTTPEIYQKIIDYTNKKQKANEVNKANNNSDNNSDSINDDNPNEKFNFIDDDKESFLNFGTTDNEFNLFQDNNSNKKPQEKPKYEDPNEISDYNKNDNNKDNGDQKESNPEPINVLFVIDDNEAFHEIKSNESGEILYLLAMQEKDEPKLYTQDGRNLTYDLLLKTTVGEIFKGYDPVLNIY